MFPMVKRPFITEEEEEEEEEEDEEREMDNGNDDDDDDEGVMEEVVNEDRKKKIMIKVVYGQELRTASASASSCSWLCCQADECGVDLRMAKKYHQRHKVCERHSKAPVVLVSGNRQRFCQQCSKFHEISRFDDTKRSCRERLAGHNERRRKTNADLQSGYEQQQPQPQPLQVTSSSREAQRRGN